MIILYTVVAILLLLAAVMTVNTLYKRPKKEQALKPERISLDKDKIARHLSDMIKFKTITSNCIEGF